MSLNQTKQKPQQISVLKTKNSDYNTAYGGARGVIVIIVGNEHGDTSSNPGRDWLHLT